MSRTTLRREIGNISRNKRHLATVVEVFNTLVTVRIVGSRQLWKNLPYIGQRPAVDQQVYLDLTTGSPYVYCSSVEPDPTVIPNSVSMERSAPPEDLLVDEEPNGHIIQDEGTDLPARPYLNFIGDGVTAEDDEANNATKVTIPGGGGPGGGHTIQDEGSDLTARTKLNFIGDGVEATDNPTTGATDVTIPGYEGASGTIKKEIYWDTDGSLSVCQNVATFVIPATMTLLGVYIQGDNTGTAGSTVVDIHKNGVTIFTNQANRPSLYYSDFNHVAVSGTPDVTDLATEDVLSIDIDAVATGAIGLSVTILLQITVDIVVQGGGTGVVGEGPGIDVVGSDVGLGGDTILVYHANGNPVSEYAPNDSGLTSALAAMSPGDWLETPPNASFSSAHTLAAGCKFYLHMGIFHAPLTMGSDCRVYGGLISISAAGGFAVGIYNSDDGKAILYGTEVIVNNSAGSATAFYLQNGGDIVFHECPLEGWGSTDGWAGYDGAGGGKAYVFDCDLDCTNAPEYFNV